MPFVATPGIGRLRSKNYTRAQLLFQLGCLSQPSLMMLATILDLSRSSRTFVAFEFVFSIPIVVYLLWRLWEFTIRPLLHPDEPRELPYTIPCM